MQAKIALQPRRAILFSAQLVSLWLVVILISLTVIVTASVVDAVMRLVRDVPFGAATATSPLAYLFGGLCLVLFYTSIAWVFSTVFRSSLGGAVGAGLLLVVAGWLSTTSRVMADVLPVQQVRAILHQNPLGVPDGIWWLPQLLTETDCGSPVFCPSVPVGGSSPSAALLMLAPWLIGFLALGFFAARADVTVQR